MHKMRQFTIAERIANGKMRVQAEFLERMILQIAPGRERSLALTKLDEALMWASAAIAEGGITTQNAGAVKHQAELEDTEKCAGECPYAKEAEPDKAAPIKDDNDRDLEKAVDALLEKMDAYGFMNQLPTDDYRQLVKFEDELWELHETYGNACNCINAKISLCKSILHDHANALRNAANKGRKAWDPKPASAKAEKDESDEDGVQIAKCAKASDCRASKEDGAKMAAAPKRDPWWLVYPEGVAERGIERAKDPFYETPDEMAVKHGSSCAYAYSNEQGNGDLAVSADVSKKQAGVTSAEENSILLWDDIRRAAQRATAAMLDKMLEEKILLERKDRPGV